MSELNPEGRSCFRGCPGCGKCAEYRFNSTRCQQCYPDNDWCDCPNGMIRWHNSRRHDLTVLRLGRDPYQSGTITVAGQEAVKAEKEFQEYQKEMDAWRRRKSRLYFT